MNRPPEIIVNSGFVTDQNGVLTEMVIPSNVVTQNIPSIITTYATTLNWIPSNAATLVEFNAPNCTAAPSNCFSGYTKLTIVSIPNLLATGTSDNSTNNNFFKGCTSLTHVSLPKVGSMYSYNDSGTFYGCSTLVSVDLPSVTILSCSGQNGGATTRGGIFANCTSLTTVNLPNCSTLSGNSSNYGSGSPFHNCTALTTISLPMLTRCTGNFGCFYGCGALQSITLGSPEHPVTSLSTNTFNSLTQSGLTITIYTSGGTALSGEPWGATNATIEYEEA